MEHVWVEAWIDFLPSRGAKHQVGDSWVPLDASFKQYQFTMGMDLQQAVPFDTQGVIEHLTQTSQFNEMEDWVSDIDQNYLQTTLQSYQTQLENYLTQTHPDATVGDVLGTQTIISAKRPVLAAGLPYQVVARGNTFATLPAILKHTLTVTLFEDATARYLGNPLLNVTLSLPVLRSQRLHLTYVPATDLDAQALADYQNDPNVTQLPLYLFRVKPVLQLEETVLAESPAVTMGQAQEYTLTLTDPSQSYPQSGTVQAGDETVFTVNGNGLTLDVLKSRAASSRDTTDVAENLHQLGLLFWFEHDWLDSLAARVYQVRTQRLPSVGVFFMPLTIQYLFSIPKSGYYHTRQIDVRRNVQMVVGETAQARFDFMSHIGIHGSYLEGSVLDQLFGQTWMPGRSTTQVLMEAAQQNIPIYTITPTNLQTVLPQLSLTADVREEIINAVSVGKTVVIPQRDVTQGRWVGTGYIIQDPVTGEGAYLIDGGYNGGSWEGCEITVKGSALGWTLNPLIGIRKTLLVQEFNLEQFKLKVELYLAMAKAKLLRKEAREIARIEARYAQLFDLSVTVFIADIAQLGAQPLYSGSGCVMPQAKATTAPEEVPFQAKKAYIAFQRNSQTQEYESTVMVDFEGKILSGCLNPRWDFGDSNLITDVATTQHLFAKTGQSEVALTVACPRNISAAGVIREDLTSKIQVFVSKVEMDIGETGHSENRIAQDDPRTDQTAQNNLLVFHNAGGDSIAIDLFKQDNNSVFWAQISKNNLLLSEEKLLKLETPTVTTHLSISNTTDADYKVKFGIDIDKSEFLEDNEVFGTYQIYGISRADYEKSRANMNSYMGNTLKAWGAWFADTVSPDKLVGSLEVKHLEAALTYRFANGEFPGKGFATQKDSDFTPTDYSQSTTLVEREYDNVTHKCGGHFLLTTPITDGAVLTERVEGRKINDQPVKAVPERLYPDATLTIPVYQYSTDSDAVNVLVKAGEFKNKLKAILAERSANKQVVLTALQGLAPGSTTTIELPLVQIEQVSDSNPENSPNALAYVPSYNAGFLNGVGLGRAKLRLSSPIKVTAILEDGIFSDSLYITEVVISGEVEDVFDYNYFTNGYEVDYVEATMSASSVQCGFNRPEAQPNAGPVAKIMVSFENKKIVFNPKIFLKSE